MNYSDKLLHAEIPHPKSNTNLKDFFCPEPQEDQTKKNDP